MIVSKFRYAGTILLILLSCALLLITLQSAVSASPSNAQPTFDVKWITERWIENNDKPYHQIRLSIDKAIAGGQNPALLAQKYRKQSSDWTNPLAQYRWAYAAYATSRQKDLSKQGAQLQSIYVALRQAQEVSPPHSYEYSRLRFLTMVRLFPSHNLVPVGRRLVQHNPKDDEARFFLASILDSGWSDEEKQEALKNTQYLIHKYLKDPKFYTLLGSVYRDSVMKARDKNAEANKAVAAYRQAVLLTSPTSAARASLLLKIKYIQDWQKRRAKKR